MRIGDGEQSYEWIEGWARIPDSSSARHGWAHPGMAVTEANEVVTCHPGEPTLLFLGPAGDLRRTVAAPVTEGHGITVSREGAAEVIWIADPGAKRRRETNYDRPPAPPAGQVVKLTLAGEVALRLGRPEHDAYREGSYSPTSVAVFDERLGGNGDVWVADGYGQSYVHRYDRAGNYLGGIDGRAGAAGAFSCPHGVYVDSRRSEPELYVADRSNRRVQVFDLEGKFKRSFGSDFLISPSAFARQGDNLIVGELHARLSVLDRDDRLVCYLGRNDAVCAAAGWPNALNERGVPTRTSRIEPGKFNSPHGLAVDGDGSIYVAEWLIGGRTIKLERAAPGINARGRDLG